MCEQFGLQQVVLVGDRGMLTQTQIAKLKQYPGLGWISALRSSAIRHLATLVGFAAGYGVWRLVSGWQQAGCSEAVVLAALLASLHAESARAVRTTG